MTRRGRHGRPGAAPGSLVDEDQRGRVGGEPAGSKVSSGDEVRRRAARRSSRRSRRRDLELAGCRARDISSRRPCRPSLLASARLISDRARLERRRASRPGSARRARRPSASGSTAAAKSRSPSSSAGAERSSATPRRRRPRGSASATAVENGWPTTLDTMNCEVSVSPTAASRLAEAESPRIDIIVTSARPIIRAQAVAAVRRGLRRRVLRGHGADRPEEPGGRPRPNTLSTGRPTSGLSSAAPISTEQRSRAPIRLQPGSCRRREARATRLPAREQHERSRPASRRRSADSGSATSSRSAGDRRDPATARRAGR